MSRTVVASGASGHAEALLGAWVAGDWRQLDRELREIAELSDQTMSSGEDERLELLKALASQLSAMGPVPRVRRDQVRLELYARLLENLIIH